MKGRSIPWWWWCLEQEWRKRALSCSVEEWSYYLSKYRKPSKLLSLPRNQVFKEHRVRSKMNHGPTKKRRDRVPKAQEKHLLHQQMGHHLRKEERGKRESARHGDVQSMKQSVCGLDLISFHLRGHLQCIGAEERNSVQNSLVLHHCIEEANSLQAAGWIYGSDFCYSGVW